jgi:hypothetical protein
MPVSAAAGAIDTLMERASEHLGAADYFRAEEMCLRALSRARAIGDFERMARIVLPLQESRRQQMLAAIDSGGRFLIDRLPGQADGLAPGLYLVRPPAIGADANALRLMLRGRRVPAVVLAREPMTRAGLWPLVMVIPGGLVDSLSLRLQVAPPPGVVPQAGVPSRDNSSVPPPAEWYVAASEAMGDAAIARFRSVEPAAHRADELFDALSALPEHEKMHQELAAACREASRQPAPPMKRRRVPVEDPYSF